MPGSARTERAGPGPSAAGARRSIAAAVLSTVLGVLPVFLLGGLAVLVREDLQFGEAQLGLAVSAFFTAAALTAVAAGRVVRRLGSWAATALAAGLSAVALVAMSLAPAYGFLLAGLVVGGAANSLAQVGSNEALARTVRQGRQGVAFGIKQASIPAATLLVGLALPAVALTLGWRPAFAGAALLALVYVLTTPRPAAGSVPAAPAGQVDADAPLRVLVVVATAAALAAGGSNAFAAFLVESTVSSGVSADSAGLLLAAGSAAGILSRVLMGWRADVTQGRHLQVVALMFLAGAAGMALLATGSASALVLGTLLAFGLGWSWPGLLIYAVVQLSPTRPARATSINQTGAFTGGAVGPLAFGLLVEAWSYGVAWTAAAGAMVAAAALMTVAQRLLAAGPGQPKAPSAVSSAIRSAE